MKVIRRNDHPQHLATPRTAPSRDQFFFYEKNTGVAHFHIEAAPDGSFPIDQAAGLLAMHCMVRGQSPSDYVVMVEAESSCIEGLAEKADDHPRSSRGLYPARARSNISKHVFKCEHELFTLLLAGLRRVL